MVTLSNRRETVGVWWWWRKVRAARLAEEKTPTLQTGVLSEGTGGSAMTGGVVGSWHVEEQEDFSYDKRTGPRS